MSSGLPSEGLFTRMRRLASSLLAMVECRVSLLAVELESDLLRIGYGLILLLIAALCAVFSLVAVLALVTVWLWDTHRLLALATSAGVLIACSVWFASGAAQRLNGGKSLLSDTLREFHKDREAFKGKPP